MTISTTESIKTISELCMQHYEHLPSDATCETVAAFYHKCKSLLGIKTETLPLLGRGSFGSVYKFDSKWGAFALKIITHKVCNPFVETYQNTFDRIGKEWDILQSFSEKKSPYFPWLILELSLFPCNCKSLVPCHYFESIGVMTLAPGEAVSVCVKKRQCLKTMSDVVTFIAQIFHAESYLNQYIGIVHADPSGRNIMWDEVNRKVTLIDFGNTAKITGYAQELQDLCTITARPPETYYTITKRLYPIQPAVIYAYGTTIFYMIAGRKILLDRIAVHNDAYLITEELKHQLITSGQPSPNWTHPFRQSLKQIKATEEESNQCVQFMQKLLAYSHQDRFQTAYDICQDPFLKDAALLPLEDFDDEKEDKK